MSSTPPPKQFTIEEANQALPLVKAIAADVVRQFRDVSERKERLSQIQRMRGSKKSARPTADPYGDEVAQIEEDLEKDVAILQGYVDELQALGVEVKDLERGLVDFRSLMDGREVYLCWQLGEDEVGHWHELHAGFGGRQSLLADSVAGGDATSGEMGHTDA